MASKLANSYRQIENNNANDAEPIRKAGCSPQTWFVSVKSEKQQAAICFHHIRQGNKF